MPAKKTTITLHQGETFRYRFRYETPQGTPVDLTGCTARMHIRSDIDSSDILLELTTQNGFLINSGVSGLIDIEVPADEVEYDDIDWAEGVFDIEVEFPDGTVDKIAYGKVKVIKEVTR
jgi:hypothetical protein